jgi:hypothetical protein
VVTTLSAVEVGAGACVGYGGCPPFGLAEAIATAAGFDVNAPFTDIIRNLAFSSLPAAKKARRGEPIRPFFAFKTKL